MKLRNALLAATVLAAPVAAAHAQAIDGLYVGAGAGGNLLQNETVKRITPNGPSNFGRGSNLKFDVGPVVVGSIGYGLGNGLRFELEGGYRDNRVRRFSAGVQTNAGGDEYKYSAFINALYDFDFGLPVAPYLGIGGGYVHDKFNNFRVSAPGQFLRSTGQTDDIGYQGIAGVSFPIYDAVPGLAFTAEYRFMGQTDNRSLRTQYFAPGVSTGPRLKLTRDDFNHSILVGVRYAFNVPTPPPPAEVPTPAPQAVARTYLVFFDWDRADLTERARQIIAEAATASTRVQTTRIDVQGNADRSGTPAYNQRLSLRRAQVVSAELVRRGVPKQEINIQAFGDTRPLVPTAAGVREPQNRRVEIILH
jgi:OOP family OmpA-OmpF porin